MENQKEKKSWGGSRQGSGRKKTKVRQVGFNAPEDIASILAKVEGSVTQYICNAIRFYEENKPIKS